MSIDEEHPHIEPRLRKIIFLDPSETLRTTSAKPENSKQGLRLEVALPIPGAGAASTGGALRTGYMRSPEQPQNGLHIGDSLIGDG